MHQGYRGQFPNSAQMMRYDDEDDMDGEDFDDMDYGLDDDDYGDYDDEESMTEAEMIAAARMQQQARGMAPQMAKAASYQGPGSMPPGKAGSSLYGGGSSIGGLGGAGSFQAGVGQIGSMGGAGAFGSGLAPSSGIGAGGGGFTYGMASQAAGSGGGIAFGQASAAGAAPFGSQPPNAMAKAKSAPQSIFGASTLAGKTAPSAAGSGTLTFGSAGQFGAIGAGGGIGSGSMPGGIGSGSMPNSMGGGDAYSGTVIDLDKIKASAPKTKPFEVKTEEEKKADAETRGTSKSNLKTQKSDGNDEKKKGVSFGRSTTYEFEESDSDGGITNKDKVERKGSPRPSKVVDLSDARTDEEKAQAALDEEANRIKEQIKKTQDWKKQQAEKTAALAPPKKSPEKDIESSGLSSSYSVSQTRSAQRKQDDDETSSSYSQGTFEEVSMSGSGSKNSSSLQAMRARGLKAKDVMESSNTYDDDFDSMTMSKSLQQVEVKKVSDGPSTAAKPMKKLPSLKDRSPSPAAGTTISMVSKYVKKDNKGSQTEVGKYSYTDSKGQTFKEKSLSSELKEAELLIQELKFQQSNDRDEVHKLEVQLQKKQGDYDAARRDAMSAKESFNRQVDKLKEVTHQNHLYKIEVESLIRQIEMADTKAREMSDELNTKEAEFNRKLEQQQERILYRKGKKEENEVSEMRREHAIQLAEERQRVEDRQEDNELLKEKVLRLEGENEKLRMARDNNKVVKKLQDEIEALKAQLPKSTSVVVQEDGFKKNLTADEQVSLQKDRVQLEKICQGYADANQKASSELHDLRERCKRLLKELDAEKKSVDTLKKQALERTERVYIEKEQDEVDMHTANLLGVSGAITHKQLKNLHDKLNEQRNEIDDLKRESAVKEGHLKSINNQTRDEKFRIERQLIDTELLVKDKELELKSLKENSFKERELNEQRISDLKEKISWYGENQKLITAQSGDVKSQQNVIRDLEAQVKEMESDSRKCRDLEKKCKLLEETIKSRNPNSMPMLLQAAKDVHEKEADNETVKKLRFKVTQLEGQLDQNDQDFQKRLRGLQQEVERQKQVYEKRTKNPEEARKVSELENELHKTKAFYQKRIAEIEKQKGYKVESKQTPRKNADLLASPNEREREQEIVRLQSEMAKLTQQVIQITKERDFFAQKNVESAHKQQLHQNRSQEKLTTIEASQPKSSYFHPFDQRETPARQPVASWGEDNAASASRTTTKLLEDLSQVQNLRSMLPKKVEYVKITQLIQILSNQMTVSKKEMLGLKKLLDDQSDCVHDGDVIAIDDLLEAIEDHAPQRPVSFHPAPASAGDDTLSLRRKMDRLQRDKDDDQDFYNAKIRQLKRRITDCMQQNKELEEEVAKLNGQKQHLEKFFKQKIGVSMKTGVAPGDVQGDVNYMMRRLEFLEDQSDERTRAQRSGNDPYRREIERLTAELDAEKAERGKMMARKNSEIAGFKAELDTLLTELSNQQSRVSNSAIYN